MGVFSTDKKKKAGAAQGLAREVPFASRKSFPVPSASDISKGYGTSLLRRGGGGARQPLPAARTSAYKGRQESELKKENHIPMQTFVQH